MAQNTGRRDIVVTTSIPERQPHRVLAAARKLLPPHLAKAVTYTLLSAGLRPGDVLVTHAANCPFAALLTSFNVMPRPSSRTGRRIHTVTNPNYNKLNYLLCHLQEGHVVLTISTSEESQGLSGKIDFASIITHDHIGKTVACIFEYGGTPENPFEIDLDDISDNLLIHHATSNGLARPDIDNGLVQIPDPPPKRRHRAGNRGRNKPSSKSSTPISKGKIR